MALKNCEREKEEAGSTTAAAERTGQPTAGVKTAAGGRPNSQHGPLGRRERVRVAR